MTAKSDTGIERMVMPAIDFKTYAREGNPHLGEGEIYPNHVIVFTGAAGTHRDNTRSMHHEILVTAGMQHAERARSELVSFKSIAPYVGAIIVPRDQLDTCMRGADIREVPDMVSLRTQLGKAIAARNEEFAEVAAMQAAPVAAVAKKELAQPVGAMGRWLARMDDRRDARGAVTEKQM